MYNEDKGLVFSKNSERTVTTVKIRIKITALLLCITMLALLLCSCGLEELIPDFLIPDDSESYHEIQDMVTVSVEDGEYYKVTSENPVKVNKGGSATFTIEIEDGYDFAFADGCELRDGVLTVPTVKYPTTVSVVLKKGSIIIGGQTGGADDEEIEKEEPKKETEIVQLTAPKAEEGCHFICWTYDVPAEEGGELLSENASGEFKIPVGKTPVANFVDDNHYVLLYRTNGGTTADGKNYYYQTFYNVNYYMPNTVYQNGTFVRDGYVLMRYTTDRSGGEYTTLGGKIEVNDNGFVELWLKWGKATAEGIEYEIYTMDDGTEAACVKSYTGTELNVVIPEKVSAVDDSGEVITYPVRKIAEYAFYGADMSTLVIPSTMHTIEDNAFVGCVNLHTLTVHDNLWDVSDEIFLRCDNLETYYLNAAHPPVFVGSGEGLFCLKYEKLRMAARNGDKKIMVMSGSSSLYGFSAVQMEEAFYGEYTVINYGTNAGAISRFYLDAFSRFFGEGDIIIHAPEMNNANQVGGNELSYLSYRGTEAMYEVYSYVDMRQYTGFFDGMRVFNQEKRKDGSENAYDSYPISRALVDKTSDMASNRDNTGYVTQSPGKGNVYNAGSVNASLIAHMNDLNARYNSRGTTMYFSFAPVNKAYVSENSLNKETQDSYVARLREVLDYEIISHPSDYIIEQEYFNNSDYHPGVTGRTMRTTALIADLKAQLIKEGKWEEPQTDE